MFNVHRRDFSQHQKLRFPKPSMLQAFTIYSGCSRLSQLSLLGLRVRVKENRGGDFMEKYGKAVSTASWPGCSKRNINGREEKRVLGKKVQDGH